MVRESDAVEAISTDLEGVDDLLSLGNLHEASILHTLRKRFFDQKQKTGVSFFITKLILRKRNNSNQTINHKNH